MNGVVGNPPSVRYASNDHYPYAKHKVGEYVRGRDNSDNTPLMVGKPEPLRHGLSLHDVGYFDHGRFLPVNGRQNRSVLIANPRARSTVGRLNLKIGLIRGSKDIRVPNGTVESEPEGEK